MLEFVLSVLHVQSIHLNACRNTIVSNRLQSLLFQCIKYSVHVHVPYNRDFSCSSNMDNAGFRHSCCPNNLQQAFLLILNSDQKKFFLTFVCVWCLLLNFRRQNLSRKPAFLLFLTGINLTVFKEGQDERGKPEHNLKKIPLQKCGQRKPCANNHPLGSVI